MRRAGGGGAHRRRAGFKEGDSVRGMRKRRVRRAASRAEQTTRRQSPITAHNHHTITAQSPHTIAKRTSPQKFLPAHDSLPRETADRRLHDDLRKICLPLKAPRFCLHRQRGKHARTVGQGRQHVEIAGEEGSESRGADDETSARGRRRHLRGRGPPPSQVREGGDCWPWCMDECDVLALRGCIAFSTRAGQAQTMERAGGACTRTDGQGRQRADECTMTARSRAP
jgi:hypothetical protein